MYGNSVFTEVLINQNHYTTIRTATYSIPVSKQLEMWANAQRDGRPAEYRWRPLFNAAKFG